MIKHDFDWIPNSDVCSLRLDVRPWHIDQVRHQTRPFLEFNDRYEIGDFVLEALRWPRIDDEAVDRAAATRLKTLDLSRVTVELRTK